MKINDILNALASNDSRNYKIDLLMQHKDNSTLREVVRLALDPLTQFYQRKIPDYVTEEKPWHTLESALDKLSKLSNREITGNAAIDYLRLLLTEVSIDDAKVIERIIQKDLRCGVSTATANKVWPNLVMDYPCMLCSQYEDKLVNKIKFPAIVQMKMDGMRFNAIVYNGTVEFRSRNGKELDLKGNLVQEFLNLSNGVNCVFDGELMIMEDNYQFADRQTGNGILNKANKGTISQNEAARVHASLWDVIPYEDFKKGVCNVPYSTRWTTISDLIGNQEEKGKRIWSVYSKEVASIDDARAEFERLYSEGYEGTILKCKNGIWENKRTKSQIKFKGELECDLKIVGIQAGTGKYAGLLGAILCESGDGVVKVSVGSGFSDDQRLNLGYELIGKIAAIKYNARITNKQGEESLFLPIVMEIREDKDIADNSGDIK